MREKQKKVTFKIKTIYKIKSTKWRKDKDLTRNLQT